MLGRPTPRTSGALAAGPGLVGRVVLFLTPWWPGLAVFAGFLVASVAVDAKGHPGFFSP
ncbi:MAG: hypothetical protein L3K16_02760 [Thermoplasmata archaeon]|nr:hypothetical protein [Thermoplasmata archaeon]